MIDHLDRIEKMGFIAQLNWNKSFEIIYDLEEASIFNALDIRVLFCSYNRELGYSFEDFIETACDFFYMWYNQNIEKIKDYEYDDANHKKFDDLLDSCLGDITQQINRDFNIDSLLD